MKNVASKLLKVIGSVSGSVAKSGYNSHQKYAYVMEKDLLDAVRPELVKNGLLLLSSVESATRTGDITTVRTKHTIVDVDSGESLEVWSAGEGKDSGDKAGYKAITGSNKYFLFKTFLLSGNDDAEADSVHDKPTESKTSTGGFMGKAATAAPAPKAVTEAKPAAAKFESKATPQGPAFGGNKPSFNATKKEAVAPSFDNSEVQF